jgi:hypothetical protein
MANLRGIIVRNLALGCVVVLAGTIVFAQTKPHSTTGKSSTKTASKPSSSKSSKKHKSNRSRKSSWRHRGQQKIDAARAREIQQALIREHYLSGEANGVWGKASQEAMERYQADNGWQTKVVPDSRALIKLGLGPDHEDLLNPATAMTEPIDAQAKVAPAAATHASSGSTAKSNAEADPSSPAKPTSSTADPAGSSHPQN